VLAALVVFSGAPGAKLGLPAGRDAAPGRAVAAVSGTDSATGGIIGSKVTAPDFFGWPFCQSENLSPRHRV